ncbi:hypothetical protein G9A89_011346 [Geosiphon pyriformis]|nr:hypothetical protein G9A89_011346 [Geosiphon pyriformis]
MSARILAQIIVTGVQIFGKATVEAWKQAKANRVRGPNGGNGGLGSSTSTWGGIESLTRQTGISIEEACQILNIKKDTIEDFANVIKQYEHLYKMNDKTKGGSFYLQCKIEHAKDRIRLELTEKAKIDGKTPPSFNSNDQSSSQNSSTSS